MTISPYVNQDVGSLISDDLKPVLGNSNPLIFERISFSEQSYRCNCVDEILWVKGKGKS